MSKAITIVGFDADDTLWHNERFFQMTQAHFADLLRDHADPDHLSERLEAAERRNLGHYGYGIKGFMLSMIETAIEVTEAKVPAHVISDILAAGQEMLSHPIELLPHAREAVERISAGYRIVLITKGDLLDQERKLAQSGLGELFDAVEIVSEKTPGSYVEIFDRHGSGIDAALMTGNSMRSDILPVLSAGGWAAHVPHELEWAVERAEPPSDADRFRQIPDLGALPELIENLPC